MRTAKGKIKNTGDQGGPGRSGQSVADAAEGSGGQGLERQVRVEPAAQRRSPESIQFRKFMFDAFHILGTIHTEVRRCGLQYRDFKAVLQGPQLFQ